MKLETVQVHSNNTKNYLETTKEIIGQCIVNIQLLHPSWKFEDSSTLKQVIDLWHYSLKRYPSHLVKKACLEVASTSKYTPKLADILEELETKSESSIQIEDKSSLNYYLSTLTEEQIDEFLERSNALAYDQAVPNPNQWEIMRANDYKDIIKEIDSWN